MEDLAINGGLPIRKKMFSPWPLFDHDEITAVSRVLQSGRVNYWTGEEGRLFENEFAASIVVNYAVALMNGTVALEAALMALNIGNGDEVIVTPRSYISSANCTVMRGAKPVFKFWGHHTSYYIIRVSLAFPLSEVSGFSIVCFPND